MRGKAELMWWEGLPGMDARYLNPAMRGVDDRACLVACAARLNRHVERDRGTLLRNRNRHTAEQLKPFLEPHGQRLSTDMDGYLRRLSLVLAVDQCEPGASRREVGRLFEDQYKFMNLVPA